jgi:hypothetical protein
MPVVGLDQVVGRLKLTLETAKEEKTEKAITLMLISGGASASSLTPVDSSFLINSQHRKTWTTDLGYAGAVYYEAFYAAWVHEMPGKLKGQPRANFGKTGAGVEFGGGSLSGNYWDPDAEPHFLKLGMEEMAGDAEAILKSVYAV